MSSKTAPTRPGESSDPATLPMHEARRQQSAAKHQAVLVELSRMFNEGEAISIAGVANGAGVSRQLIYSSPELLTRVEALRETQRHNGVKSLSTTHHTPASTASLKTDLALARQEIARLRNEVSTLRSELRSDLGLRLDQARRSEATQALQNKEIELQQVLAQRNLLEAEKTRLARTVAVLEDELVAAREALAAMIRDSNRGADVRKLR